MCANAGLSKQCGGVQSDKASADLLVQFLCETGDKRTTLVCLNTHTHTHTTHTQTHTQLGVKLNMHLI